MTFPIPGDKGIVCFVLHTGRLCGLPHSRNGGTYILRSEYWDLMEGRGYSQFWKMTIRLEGAHVIWLGIFGFLGHLRIWEQFPAKGFIFREGVHVIWLSTFGIFEHLREMV